MFMFMHTCTHIRHIYFYSQIAQLVASGPLSNWLDRLDCSESAKTLDECRTQAVGEASDSCSLNSYVAVACVNSKSLNHNLIIHTIPYYNNITLQTLLQQE